VPGSNDGTVWLIPGGNAGGRFPCKVKGEKMQTRRVLATAQWVVLGISVLIIALGSSGLLAGPMENAAANSKTCTVSNVAGSYGLSGRGTIVSNHFGLPEGPVATVGVITFDE
jgi:hypothetical protein